MTLNIFEDWTEMCAAGCLENCLECLLSSSSKPKGEFEKHFEEILGRCNTRYHRVRLIVNKKMGTKPVHHITNLQTMRPASFRIWLPFDHNNVGHDHQQNSMAPEQVYPTCHAFTKIH